MMNNRNYIRYRRTAARRRAQNPGGGRKLAVCILLVACALMCKLCYPNGVATVQDLLLGQEGGRLQRGVRAVATAISEHESLENVVEAFWHGLSSEVPA